MVKDWMMIKNIARNLVQLKKEFVRVYDGTSHIQEVVPLSESDEFPIETQHLNLLHTFAKSNPIYYDSYEKAILDVPCMVYEGDINRYWLNSIQHGSSCAPFSPTWILSAYVSSLMVKSMGHRQVLDIGSGDGRIAYCAKILDLDSYSLEIDGMLFDLQNSILNSTGIYFNPTCANAISFDYSSLNLTSPSFFIGGLAQMGGAALACGVLDNIQSNPAKKNTGMVFPGTLSKKYSSDPMSEAGWGTLIHKNNLQVVDTIILPTMWTFKEPVDTPYIFTELF